MNKSKLSAVHIYDKDDLASIIISGIEQKLEDFKQNFQAKEPTQLLNRKETAVFFGVSTPTIDAWVNNKLLIAYRQGNRKYFKRKELEEALTRIDK